MIWPMLGTWMAVVAAVATPEPGIVELPAAPAIDGDLSEWAEVGAYPIPFRNGERSDADGPARVRLGYDEGHLYLALEVPDDTLVFRERSWRYGDGFYLTVLMPGTGGASASHIGFGFSRVGDRLERVVVNRSGEYFPAVGVAEVRFAMSPAPADLDVAGDTPVAYGGAVAYEVAVPWALLAPAHPLLVDSLAVNVVTTDSDGGASRVFGMLEPDPDFDTERTPVRRGRPLPLVRRPGAGGGAALGASRPVVELGGPFDVLLGWRPDGAAPGREAARVELVQAGRVVGVADTSLGSARDGRPGGIRRVRAAVAPDSSARTGPATLRARIGGGVREGELFLVDHRQLDGLERELERIEGDAGSPAAVRAAVPAALLRLARLRRFAGSAPSNAPIARAARWWRELESMAAGLRAGRSPLAATDGLLELAHRSGIDGTIQPYSVHLPDGYDPGRPGGYPALVALHGSGVTEGGTVRTVGSVAAPRGWIVIAPRGRGLSDWYLGDAGTDVLEALDHARRLLAVDTARVALVGFSMGGYGTWRLALRHGSRFRAAAVLSGAACPPAATAGRCIGRLLDDRDGTAHPALPVPPLLVVHGALDRAVPVDAVRPLVDRARRFAPVDYREVPDAAHGRVEWWRWALDWIEEHVESR